MNDLIRRTRELLVSTPDTVCLERARLATEGYRRFGDEPITLCRANTFAHILDNMTLDLRTNPVFAGNTSSRPRAWMLIPEHGFVVPNQALQEHPELDGFLDGNAIPDDLREFWAERSVGGGGGTGHLAVDMGRVLSEGLEGIIAEARSYEASDYRRAMIISCEAVMGWANRYSEAALIAAQEATDPQVKYAFLRVADACRRVPAKPARTLFDALQTIAFVHLAVHIEGHGYSVSLGLLDRILRPYYDGAGETTELLAAFLLKVSANSLWGSHSKTQAITLGGLDHQGNDRCNDLTLRFLDACDLVRMPDPHLFIRWHERIDPQVKARAIELLSDGLSMPLLIGDEQTAQGFIQAGVAEEDAWDYCVIGCNELGIPGRLASSASGPTLNCAVVLREMLLEASDTSDMSDLSDRLRAAMKARLASMLKNRMIWWPKSADRVPTPFTSALMDGCVRDGCDMHVHMRYNQPGLMERGFVNAVNGLAAIDHTVFREKSLTLGDIADGLRDDFKDPLVRARILAAPKWGNDDERADRWALELLETRRQVVEEIEQEIGSGRHVNCHVVRSLHHVEGKRIEATPDGRLAHTPLADSIGPPGGMSAKGPTALLRSVMKLRPAEFWAGGYNLNLTLAKGGAPDAENLTAMVDAFFAHGGQELQIAFLNAEQLRDAQAHPELHGDLLVRIAGFNALFVHLSPEEQAEMIQRAESLG